MTLHKRYLLEMTDILSLRLTCRKCKISLTVPIAKEFIHEACPQCTESWFSRDGAEYRIVQNFLDELSVLKSRGKEAACHLQLEIEQPD